VSGYLVQLASDIEALDGRQADRRLHRPARVDGGVHPRCGLDRAGPDVGLFASEGHIPLAATPNPASARHQRRHAVCNTTLEFSNTVTRVHEDPRVTLPYTEKAWQTICAVGQRVDEQLAAPTSG